MSRFADFVTIMTFFLEMLLIMTIRIVKSGIFDINGLLKLPIEFFYAGFHSRQKKQIGTFNCAQSLPLALLKGHALIWLCFILTKLNNDEIFKGYKPMKRR